VRPTPCLSKRPQPAADDLVRCMQQNAYSTRPMFKIRASIIVMPPYAATIAQSMNPPPRRRGSVQANSVTASQAHVIALDELYLKTEWMA
jgi:hypothetical protein